MRLNVKLKATFAGKFKLKKTNTITGEVEETGWFDNLILDQGLNLKGSEAWTSDLLGKISVGTGTTAPVNGNTDMETLVARTSDTGNGGGTTNSGSSPWYMEVIVVKRFPTGTFSGEALSEIGIGTGTPTLFARALILDGGGSPTTITLGADDVLDATYILRQYRDGESDDNTLAFNSVTDGGGPVGHTGTIRAAWMDIIPGVALVRPGRPVRTNVVNMWVHEDATLGAITGENPLGSGSSATESEAAYGSGNFYRDFTGAWSLGSANFGNDITGLTVLSPLGKWQMVFTPAIQKDNTQVLDITIRLSWDRHTP